MKIQLRGLKEMQDKLRRLQKQYPNKIRKSVRFRCELIMTKAKEEAPKDTGNMAATGIVEDISEGNKIAMQLSFGGPAEPYTEEQHENLSFRHTVGKAKFLEDPLLQAVPTLADEVAHDCQLHQGDEA